MKSEGWGILPVSLQPAVWSRRDPSPPLYPACCPYSCIQPTAAFVQIGPWQCQAASKRRREGRTKEVCTKWWMEQMWLTAGMWCAMWCASEPLMRKPEFLSPKVHVHESQCQMISNEASGLYWGVPVYCACAMWKFNHFCIDTVQFKHRPVASLQPRDIQQKQVSYEDDSSRVYPQWLIPQTLQQQWMLHVHVDLYWAENY